MAAASSTGALQPQGASAFSFQTPFTDLLRGVGYDEEDSMGGVGDGGARGGGANVRRDGRPGGGVPRFKSAPPPSLPLSPAPASPSSFFAIPAGLSPADLLDSPVLLAPSNILPSPTTGSFPGLWKIPQHNQQQQQPTESIKPAETKDEPVRNYSDFSFQTAISQHQPWNNYQEELEQKPSTELPPQNAQTNNNNINHNSMVDSSSVAAVIDSKPPPPQQQQQPASGNADQPRGQQLEDGYNWRKYGQKQVKASENPRSYYKCTHPGCPTKKKVERSLVDGRVTEIVYRGSHDHPKPQSTRRNSSSSGAGYYSSYQQQQQQQQQQASSADQQVESAGGTPENSSVSFEDTDGTGRDEVDGEEPEAKRWRSDGSDITSSDGTVPCSSGGGMMNRGAPVREPRVVVQTTSDVDILDDGYRWRKYGQKVVKGNPNPRSYYKCTTVGCPVRKHVERACHDPRAVITTYEGKHNHDVPAARGSGLARQLQQQQQQQQQGGGGDAPSAVAVPLRPAAVAAGMYRGNGQTHGGYQPAIRMLQQQRHDVDADGSTHSGGGGGSGDFSSAAYGVDNSAFIQQLLLAQQNFQEAKEEPREDAFLDSFLC